MEAVKECHAIQCNASGQLPVYQKVHLSELGNDDVLVKVEATGIGHLEHFLMNGAISYMGGSFPFIPGTDGVGTVTQGGNNAKHLIGKRVIVYRFFGMWSDYTVASMHNVFEVNQDVPVESAAFGFGNPFTVVGLIDTIEKEGKKSVILDAAASALGRMFNKLIKGTNLKVINVVKREDQKETLAKEGAENILVTDGNWKEQFEKLTKELGSDCLVDSLGTGDVYDILVHSLSPGGLVLGIGGLECESLNDIGSQEKVEAQNITIQSWNVMQWINGKSPEEKQKYFQIHSDRLKKELATTVQQKFHFKDIQKALEASKVNSTKGKIMLVP